MRVLIACEESQTVCTAIRARGHDAYSCDLKPCTGGHPEWHIQGDVLERLNDGWDMMIAHPPCTHLSVSGARWFKDKEDEQIDAIIFFLELVNADDIPRICIENPVGIMSTIYRKPDQYIQPYQFGHDASKKTGLWLKGLPELVIDPSEYIPPRTINGKPRWANQTDSGQNKLGPSENRATIRAKTYDGIARAMARQWLPGKTNSAKSLLSF